MYKCAICGGRNDIWAPSFFVTLKNLRFHFQCFHDGEDYAFFKGEEIDFREQEKEGENETQEEGNINTAGRSEGKMILVIRPRSWKDEELSDGVRNLEV